MLAQMRISRIVGLQFQPLVMIRAPTYQFPTAGAKSGPKAEGYVPAEVESSCHEDSTFCEDRDETLSEPPRKEDLYQVMLHGPVETTRKTGHQVAFWLSRRISLVRFVRLPGTGR